MSKITTNKAWELLIEKYDILNKIDKDGFFYITSEQIREFKEARLMAKWDSSESLPKILKDNRINILPTSRGTYVLSDFKLYHKIPELMTNVQDMPKVELMEYETIDINNITSEANAINVLLLSNILDDFLGETDNASTFNGRMGSEEFSFKVDRYSREPLSINVKNAQCEIDAGLENHNSVIIIEAKNVIHPDFHIRQLYYPYRRWENVVNKPIRLIFTIYSNQIYRLFEYQFEDLKDYSSISLIREKNYSLQDTDITTKDLEDVYKKSKIIYSDNMAQDSHIPFIQADSFERVISLMEVLADENKTEEEIANIMQFAERQSGYYFNAGRYLGIFEKIDEIDELGDKKIYIQLTKKGKEIYSLPYKKRQLRLVELMLEHRIFNQLFGISFNSGKIPDKNYVEKLMLELNVCGKSYTRRSQTVISWLEWIYKLIKI